jgi:hypothetical protein
VGRHAVALDERPVHVDRHAGNTTAGRPDVSQQPIAVERDPVVGEHEVGRVVAVEHGVTRCSRPWVDRITVQVADTVEAANLEAGPAADALTRCVESCWGLMERYPVLLNASIPAAPTPAGDRERHQPIIGPLTALVCRGQTSGEFDDSLPADWFVMAVIALGHAAGAQVAGGRMSTVDAAVAFRRSVLRLCLRPSP